MKALTIYQPFATFVVRGCKPYEFRSWNYAEKFPHVVNERIVIHAAKKRLLPGDIIRLSEDILFNGGDGTKIDGAFAAHLITKMRLAMEGEGASPPIDYCAGIGTAVIGHPVHASRIWDQATCGFKIPDMWGWPMMATQAWETPVEYKGNQGFWNWPFDMERAA